MKGTEGRKKRVGGGEGGGVQKHPHGKRLRGVQKRGYTGKNGVPKYKKRDGGIQKGEVQGGYLWMAHNS